MKKGVEQEWVFFFGGGGGCFDILLVQFSLYWWLYIFPYPGYVSYMNLMVWSGLKQ